VAKGFFDFTRNVAILGVLKYISTKSSSIVFDAFFALAVGMMWAYINSLCQGWRFQPFHFLEGRWGWWLNTVVDGLLATALTAALIWGLGVAVDEIAKAQVKSNQCPLPRECYVLQQRGGMGTRS